MNRTIYISPDDGQVWFEAKKLAEARGISMGKLIIEALRMFVRPRLTGHEVNVDRVWNRQE